MDSHLYHHHCLHKFPLLKIDVFDLFECSTGGSCVLLEEKGGGDNFYEEDVTLVREAIIEYRLWLGV